MDTSPSIIAVIVTWNKEKDVLRCLKQVYRSSIQPVEIVVVDNASEDDTVAKVAYHFPGVNLLKQTENSGGSGGFNAGMRYALSKSCDFIWLLDNDAIPGVRFLHSALPVFDDVQVAIVGAQILDINQPHQTVELGAFINWHKQGTTANLRNKSRVRSGQLFEVDYVPICCALVRRTAIQDIGLLDPAYFLHWDDMDWGWRFRTAGYKVIACSSALAWHKPYEGIEPPIAVQYYDHRNAMYFYSKYTKGLQRSYLLAYGVIKRGISFAKNTVIWRHDRIRVGWDAMLDFFSNRMGKNQRTWMNTK